MKGPEFRKLLEDAIVTFMVMFCICMTLALVGKFISMMVLW